MPDLVLSGDGKGIELAGVRCHQAAAHGGELEYDRAIGDALLLVFRATSHDLLAIGLRQG